MAHGNIIFRGAPVGFEHDFKFRVDANGDTVLTFPDFEGEVYDDIYCTERDGNGVLVNEVHAVARMNGMQATCVIEQTGQPVQEINSV